MMDYYREYKEIGFRVQYSRSSLTPNQLAFFAQPYEDIVDKETRDFSELYLVHGRVESELSLRVGFKGFLFDMSEDLHSRLGLLYKMVLIEYKNTHLKKI